MAKDGPQHFERQPVEPLLGGDSLSEINGLDATAASSEQLPAEGTDQINLEAELQKAREALADIDAGVTQVDDPKARDRAMIDVVFLERELSGAQWHGADSIIPSKQTLDSKEDNSRENSLPKEG